MPKVEYNAAFFISTIEARVTLFRKNMYTKLIENSPLQETLNLH